MTPGSEDHHCRRESRMYFWCTLPLSIRVLPPPEDEDVVDDADGEFGPVLIPVLLLFLLLHMPSFRDEEDAADDDDELPFLLVSDTVDDAPNWSDSGATYGFIIRKIITVL